MDIELNGLKVSVGEDEISRLVLDRLNGIEAKIVDSSALPPAVGTEWRSRGGIYAGVMRGRDGGGDYYLIVGPEREEACDLSTGMQWAGEICAGALHRDFSLPYRNEQALLFANTLELFKPEAYWSREEYASATSDAWYQTFGDGGQHYWCKGLKLRVRAVRRFERCIGDALTRGAPRRLS